MPNHKSAYKRARQNIKRRSRNMAIRSTVRTTVKKVRAAIGAGNKEAALNALKSAVASLDCSVSKGVHHFNNASRRVSRLARQVNRMS